MFWLDNLNELFNPILYPNMNMTIDEKINAIIRLILSMVKATVSGKIREW